MRAEMDEALLKAAHSGAYIMGPQVAELELQLADYVGVKHCITCANGTDALRMSLLAIGLLPSETVFVPDFTFFASAEVVALEGSIPVFVDVDSDTFNIDIDDLEVKYRDVLENGFVPRAVMAVDLFGQPANYNELVSWCRSRSLILIEDGAQGFGGCIGKQRACSFGDIATTSFFPAKPLGCYGDGGAIFTNNDLWAERLRSLRVHGKGTDKYDNLRFGFNSRLDTLQAAVLQVKMRHFDEELKAVNHVAERDGELLQGKVKVPEVPEGFTSSWAQYTIQTENRDELQARLKAAGIPSMVYYPRTMSQQTAFAYYGLQPCPVAERLTKTVLSLPMHPYLTDEEIDRIISIVLTT